MSSLSSSNRGIVVALTGASGIRYGVRLVEVLSSLGLLEAIIYTRSAAEVARYEESIDLVNELSKFTARIYMENDFSSPYASSSNIPRAIIVAPCSMNTLAKIAHGLQDNLVTRAVLSALRLRRKVVLVIRETPLGLPEITNMLLATLNGAIILPASPGFYHKPRTINDMVDFIVGKVLDVLGISHSLYRRWGSH